MFPKFQLQSARNEQLKKGGTEGGKTPICSDTKIGFLGF